MKNRAAYMKRWQSKNKAKLARYNKRYREANSAYFKDYNKRWQLANRYNLTLEAFKAACKKQQHKCKICNKKPATLVVDHCHKSNKVRGLICPTCNLGLGYFQDNLKLLGKALQYLLQFNKQPITH